MSLFYVYLSLATKRSFLTQVGTVYHFFSHTSKIQGWVKRQRNPTDLLGFILLLRNANAPQPNLRIKTFSNLEKVLFMYTIFSIFEI